MFYTHAFPKAIDYGDGRVFVPFRWSDFPPNSTPDQMSQIIMAQLPKNFQLVPDMYCQKPVTITKAKPRIGMGNALTSCNLHERTVFWPVQHVVEFHGIDSHIRAQAKLNTREHCDSGKLRLYLVAQFGLTKPESTYKLYYAKLPLTQSPPLFQILPANSVVDLILDANVSFVVKEE